MLDGSRDGVDLVVLMVEQAGNDLLKRPLAVGEPHRARGWHGVQLGVGEPFDAGQCNPGGLQMPEEGVQFDVRVAVRPAVRRGLVSSGAVPNVRDELRDAAVAVDRVGGDGADGPVAEFFAAGAWPLEPSLARARQALGQFGELAISCFVKVLCAVHRATRGRRRR